MKILLNELRKQKAELQRRIDAVVAEMKVACDEEAKYGKDQSEEQLPEFDDYNMTPERRRKAPKFTRLV